MFPGAFRLHQQEAWVTAEVSKHPKDPYWQAIGLLLAQNEGLAQGYKARAAEEPEGSDVVGHLSEDDLLFLSSNGGQGLGGTKIVIYE